MRTNDTLTRSLEMINETFDIDSILNEKQGSKEIKTYYRSSHLAYLLFHNKEGFIHMGISKNGTFSKSDLLAQCRTIEQYIQKTHAANVLELGPGNGANSAYLATKFPKVAFSGLDLSKKTLGRFKKIKNYTQDSGDYHDLGRYKNNSFDIIFGIETVCHSNNKFQVLTEIYKKVKPGGFCIIFDGYRNKRNLKYSEEELLAVRLTEKSMAVDEFETIQSFEETIRRSKFNIQTRKDLSEDIMPTLARFEKESLIFYKHRLLKKLLKKIVPQIVLKNSIAGLLMPQIFRKNLVCYYLHVLTKN